MTRREERLLMWLLAVFAVLLLIAPIGGASLIEAVIAIVRKG